MRLCGRRDPAPRGQRNPHVFTRDNIVAGVEQSLARMKTDHLDVVQFHASPSKQTLEEHDALEALLSLKRAGKVRFIGMSATLPHLADHIGMGVFDVFQIPYSAVEREHEAIISSAAESGAGIVIRGGAAKGAPSGAGGAGTQWERPDMATNIVGTINPAHLRDNIVALLQGPLPPALCAEVKRRLAAAGSTP
jgi:aryl-alcohol dehydrogenase-like predicted oxidoreductase